MSDVKLLCAADLHLGRRPTRLPGAAGSITAASSWLDLVERAVAEGMVGVLLAGDIVDEENRYFEAYGPLEAGVRRLKEAGIALVAVAGNHDHATLHEVAAEVGQGHLVVLGRGGAWERHTIRDAEGKALVHVDGWSFPESRWGEDPTAGYGFESPADGAPVVGLLHCDLDARESRYAPVVGRTLAGSGPDAWVLGHVHKPRLDASAGVPMLYPGSLAALDPGEPGRHGGWLLETGCGAPARFRPIALSRVRYEDVDVALDGVDDEAAVRARVVGALRERLDAVVDEGCGPLEILSCRLRLGGRTPLHHRVSAALGRIEDLDLAERQGVRLSVQPRFDDDTAPALDLVELARGSDAPALLARLLLALEGRSDAASLLEGVLGDCRSAADRVLSRSHFAAVAEAESGDEGGGGVDPSAALRRQAYRLLDELMRTKAVA